MNVTWMHTRNLNVPTDRARESAEADLKVPDPEPAQVDAALKPTKPEEKQAAKKPKPKPAPQPATPADDERDVLPEVPIDGEPTEG